MIPEHYIGREQALIKHTLLRGYIEKLFMIKGRYERTISYVDCFAGPWEEDSSDFDDTSAGISLGIIQECKEALRRVYKKDVHFRSLFIEKNPKSYGKLKSFVESSQWSNIETKAFKGDFCDLRREIVKWCGEDSFAFFFVDPCGWKDVAPDTLIPLLQRPKSEYLVNFMFDFINRFYTEAAPELFGTVEDLSSMAAEEREEHLITLYQERLRKNIPSGQRRLRSARVRVMYPVKDRTIYYLVYLTRHPLGIVKFMEESEELADTQTAVRATAKQWRRIRQTSQGELFPATAFLPIQSSSADPSRVKDYWLSKLDFEPKRFGMDELADMLEETGWFISDFQSAFKGLQEEKRVKNLDAHVARPKNVVHFQQQGERLVRLEP